MAIKSADQITIVDVTDAYSIILTSEAYTFVGGTSGVAAGNTCTTQAVAFCGSNQCKAVTVNVDDIVCPAGITASVSNSGTASPTITFSTTATVSTACEATIPVTVDGITINKKFSFAVAKTGATGATGQTGATGAAGKGVKSTAVTYQSSTSGTTVPTGTWGSTIPTVSAGQYLWTRTIITYTDDTTSTSYSIGKMGETGATGQTGPAGATGKGVKSTAVTYQSSTSGTSVPTGTWSESIPSVAAGSFLWTRTVMTYTDNTSSTSYSVGKMGNNGATGAAGADAIVMTITSSNGTVFKNNSGSTVLTAHVFKGGVEQSITDAGVCGSLGTVKWYKGNDTSTVVATAKTLTVSASSITNSAVYTAQLE